MTAVLYSEGPLDLGHEEPFEQGSTEGPLRVLIRQLLDGGGWLLVESRPLSRNHNLPGDAAPHGLDHKASRALRDAKRDGDDAVFIVIDRDGREGAVRLGKLKKGRESVVDAVPSAFGVAQEMVESWLMGDVEGWKRCFGSDLQLPPSDPEINTGTRRSKRYAKTVLQALAGVQGRCPTDEKQVETYTRLALCLDWKVVAKTCHRSFAPFAAEVRERVGKSLRIVQ